MVQPSLRDWKPRDAPFPSDESLGYSRRVPPGRRKKMWGKIRAKALRAPVSGTEPRVLLDWVNRANKLVVRGSAPCRHSRFGRSAGPYLARLAGQPILMPWA